MSRLLSSLLLCLALPRGQPATGRRRWQSCRVRGGADDPGFRGDIAEAYTALFVQFQPIWDEFRSIVQERLPRGEGVLLDVATGPGEPARTISRSLPGLQVIATDLQEGMVQQAKARLAHVANASACVASALDLAAYADSSVDVVTVNFGHPFVPDVPRALREVYRVLKPGGTLVTTYWRSIAQVGASQAVLQAVANRTELTMDPLSLAAPGHYRDLVRAAGLRVVETRDRELVLYFASPTKAFLTMTMPVLAQLTDIFRQDEAAEERGRATFTGYLKDRGFLRASGIVVAKPNNWSFLIAEKPKNS